MKRYSAILVMFRTWIFSMKSKHKQAGCPVCGYADFVPFDNCGFTTFEICCACGSQSGYDYSEKSNQADFLRLRRSWVIDRRAEWWSPSPAPDGWDPQEQMNKADFSI